MFFAWAICSFAMAGVSWLGSFPVLCMVALSFVANLTLCFDVVSVPFGSCGGSLYSNVVPALVCAPELCILVVFTLFLVFMSTSTLGVTVQTGFLQFLKLMSLSALSSSDVLECCCAE